MSTETVQHEKSFQKQEAVFVGRSATKTKAKGGHFRYTRKVGLGFKTPTTAITGNYVDKKCPFTGNVSIRGRILKGTVKNHKVRCLFFFCCVARVVMGLSLCCDWDCWVAVFGGRFSYAPSCSADAQHHHCAP
jgi:hypothetical protein